MNGDEADGQFAKELREVEESWAFRAARYAFSKNAKECLDYLHVLEHMEPDKILRFAGELDGQEETSFEVMRLFSNCVGAAVSMRNAVNGVYGRLHRDGSFPEFNKERRKRYDRHPIIQFTIKLRDYLVHVKPIGVIYHFGIPEPTDISTTTMEVRFNLSGLDRDAKSWRDSVSVRAAKRYLEDLEGRKSKDRPTLFMHLLAFRMQVEDFYNWFAERETELQHERLGEDADHSASKEPPTG